MKTTKRKIKIGKWLGLLLVSLLVLVIVAGILIYSRFTNFAENTFNGRNEISLLTATPANTQTSPIKSPVTITTATQLPTPLTTQIESTTKPAPATNTISVDENLSPVLKKLKKGQQLTFLIVGYGGQSHEGPFLTDTIILAIYDSSKNIVTMVNIPRDLYVFIPYGGPTVGHMGKINSAFATVMEAANSNGFSPRYRFQADNQKSRIDAGINLLKDIVEQISGVTIDNWLTLDFTGFKSFVDVVGGVDLTVDNAFDDYEYPATDDPNLPYRVMHIHFDAGFQHLNGERALQFIRSRHSAVDGNDFNRSKRQMKFLIALKERLTQQDLLLKAFGIMDALQGNLRTSLSFGELRELLDYYQGAGVNSAKNMKFSPQILSTDNFLINAVSSEGSDILYPAAGKTNYKLIQDWITKIRQNN